MQKSISNRYGLEAFAEALREARLAKTWSQRDLSARAHIPQAQISRIENGSVDLQLSSLLELARALELEVQLVPRSALPSIKALIREVGAQSEAPSRRPAYSLDDEDGA